MTDVLTVATEGQVALLTLNRPARYHALTVELKTALLAAVRELAGIMAEEIAHPFGEVLSDPVLIPFLHLDHSVVPFCRTILLYRNTQQLLVQGCLQ